MHQTCFLSQHDLGKCTRPNPVFLMTCLTCQKVGEKSHYLGESGRIGWDRGQENWAALENMDDTSPWVEHLLEKHREGLCAFSMKITSFQRSNIMRQATEASEIQKYPESQLMNRKGEWGQNLSPKLTIEG